jgi:selenocysteine-specific elongation factor
MHVVATAGHVDHGKSSLVRALTGMEPDRWAEERRRGLTIDLGFAWTTLGSGDVMAFVDVPGHERFITNMLAGIGSAPAALLVVAADEGWMPQTAEHLRALDALGVREGLLVVTKSDLADPMPVVREVASRLADTTLCGVDAVTVSATTEDGLDDVRRALVRLAQRLPAPDASARVRLWVDRCFTMRGAGTVVTGTLAAGTIRVGDRLSVAGTDASVVVRGVQSRGADLEVVTATARVALNVRGVDRADLPRGTALVTPGQWLSVDEVDVMVGDDMPRDVVVHVGSAAVPGHARRLGEHAFRLRLDRPVPLQYGDRLLLREPSSRAIVGVTVADPAPRPLRRRGDAAAFAAALRVPVDATEEVRRRGAVRADWLAAAGLGDRPDALRIGEWWVDGSRWEHWRAALADLANAADGVPASIVRDQLELPDPRLFEELVATLPTLRVTNGLLTRRDATVDLAEISDLLDRLRDDPFAAPDGDEIRRLDRGALARGVRAGRLLQIAPGLYLAPDAPDLAVARLAQLSQPFTVSAATRALGSSRRVVVPLLEHLDAVRRARKLADGTRVVVGGAG